MTRIAETRQRAAATEDKAPRRPRHEMSFTERYRGTEFETDRSVVVTHEPSVSRGRTFVLVSGLASIGICAAMVLASGS